MGYTPDEANSSYSHLLVTTSAFAHNNDVISRLDEFGFSAKDIRFDFEKVRYQLNRNEYHDGHTRQRQKFQSEQTFFTGSYN